MPKTVDKAQGRSPLFDRFAESSSRFVSSGLFFALSLIVVVLWMPTIAVFDSVDTWQLVINTATSILAFLLVALLQNSERRKDEAAHVKLDAIAVALAALMRHAADGEEAALHDREQELRASVGLEEKI
jgi:low affinity Fe/Cu permease